MHNPGAPPRQASAANEVKLPLLEAIVRRRIVQARYNSECMKLAPHLLFDRHGDLFVGALNMGKAWRSPDEMRLGYFKLSGLSEVKLTDETFAPLPSIHLALPCDDDLIVLAVSDDALIAN